MKPMGVTWDFRVQKPSRAEDAIWEAVREAIDEGMSADVFRREAASAWREALRDDAESAAKTLTN